MTDKQLAPDQIGVKSVPTDELVPNPHNPRYLFDKEPLKVLRESIGKVGILVPLTVYLDSKKKRYVILDGQRRWMCAQELRLPKIPVNQVAEPSLVQNIVTMFQIHKLRQDWELMPTALKLEVLMNELKETSDAKLAALTGLNQAVVVRCKKLLSYSKSYQDLMLDPDPEKRVKADFFIELHPVLGDRVLNKMQWFSKEKFTGQMLKKYQARKLKSVTEFRLVKQNINNARRANKIKELEHRLKDFAEKTECPVEHLDIKSISVSAEANRLQRSIEKLESEIHGIDVEKYYGQEGLWGSLERLTMTIRLKIKEAGRRPVP